MADRDVTSRCRRNGKAVCSGRFCAGRQDGCDMWDGTLKARLDQPLSYCASTGSAGSPPTHQLCLSRAVSWP